MTITDVANSNFGLFNCGIHEFWAGNLQQLLLKFPLFKSAHRQDFFLLLYCKTGGGSIQIDRQIYTLESGSVYVIKPTVISSLHAEDSTQGVVICFSQAFLSLKYDEQNRLLKSPLRMSSPAVVVLPESEHSYWEQLVGLICADYELVGDSGKLTMVAYLTILLAHLSRHIDKEEKEQFLDASKSIFLQYEMLIDQHLIQKKLPSEYAELLSVSANYLNKICKAESGESSGVILRRKIAEEAKRQLYYTSLTVREIAARMGFQRDSYFVTFFKNQTGLSPEQFRRNSDRHS